MKEREIIELWSNEKVKFEEIKDEVCEELNNILKNAGVFATVDYRLKEVDSIIKKILRKGKSYECIYDKLGFRIIVKFQSELKLIDKAIQNYFKDRIVNIDDKSTNLRADVFGYQSIHYDFLEKAHNLYFELQIRTICQHNWSLMSHELSYKNEEYLPIDIKRKINALSALFEVADTQFQSINESVLDIKSSFQYQLIEFLENKFLKLTYKKYDREMTNYFLNIVEKIYVNESVFDVLDDFFIENETLIGDKINSNEATVFYSQPEIIIILERIVNKKTKIKKHWPEIYPIDYLEDVANFWGVSLE